MDDNFIVICGRTEDPFARIPKKFLDEPRLSWRAKGLMAYLLGKPPGWKVRVTDLRKHAKEGRDAIRSALQELRNLGYGELVRVRDKGKITGTYWKLSDCPIFKIPPQKPPKKKPRIHRRPEKPSDGKPVAGKSGHIVSMDFSKTDYTKKDLSSIEERNSSSEEKKDPITGEYIW